MNNRKTSTELAGDYLNQITSLLGRIKDEESAPIEAAASLLAEQVRNDRLIHVYGPGGHSNLASQEVFFRAGGLMHMSAILDEGTLLSNGALRSMAMERNPGYGRIVIDDAGLGDQDVLIIVNSSGINSASIDAALRARERSVKIIGITSAGHANGTAQDHVARHASKQNLHDLVDIHIDSKVAIGDAVIKLEGLSQPAAAVSTFANVFTLNWLVLATLNRLVELGIDPPVWKSGNGPGGDEANEQHLPRFKGRVRKL